MFRAVGDIKPFARRALFFPPKTVSNSPLPVASHHPSTSSKKLIAFKKSTETVFKYHGMMEQENKAAILATVERLSSPNVPVVPLRTLASEMRKKPSQRTLVPQIVEESQLDPKLLNLLLSKLSDEGYVVSAIYATKFLRQHSEKLVPALKAIKNDLKCRETAFQSSGRVSVSQETDERAGTSSFQTRDQLISFLELEDRQYRELAEKGWNSAIGRSLKVNGRYRNERQREQAMEFYLQENKFREARAEFYKSCEKQLQNAGELEKCMQEWERNYRESETPVPGSGVEQAARAGHIAGLAHDNSPPCQAPAVDENEGGNHVTGAGEDGKVSIDNVMEKAQDIAVKLQEVRSQADANPFPYRVYDPYEKIASKAETFRMKAQDAAYVAAKASPSEAKEYEPNHMNERNFPKTLTTALDSEEFCSEDNVVDCLKYLAESMGNENAELRKERMRLKQEKLECEARREEERITETAMEILYDPVYRPPHAGKTLEVLLTVIPKLVTGPKPVSTIQAPLAKRDVTKNMRQIYDLLVESEAEQIHIHELREHLKGKTVGAALSEAYSERNVKWLDPILTDGMRGELLALFDAAKKVDEQIKATEQYLMQESDRDKARANVNRPIKDFVDGVGETLMVVHEELMEIPYSHPKLERMRRDLQERHTTLVDCLQEEWTYAIRGTIYNKIKNDTLEAIWNLIVQAAKYIDKSLKEKPTKQLAANEDLKSSLLCTLLDQLRTPLMELLPREADMPGAQTADKMPNINYEKGPYKSAVLRLFQEYENIPEETRSKISKTTDRVDLVEKLWNQPEVIQSLEEAALTKKGKGNADYKSYGNVLVMHAYALRLLQAPLIKKMVAKKLQEEVRLEAYLPLPEGVHDYRLNFPVEVMDEVEGLAQQIMYEGVKDHDFNVQRASQEPLEAEKTRKLKKSISVSEGLRKKMAKARIEKRLSEVFPGGAASKKIDLKEGFQVWNEDHASETTEEKKTTVKHISNGVLSDDPNFDHKFIAFAVNWWKTKGKYGARLSGHENCDCSAGQHAELVEILKNTAETAEKLGFTTMQKAAAQTSLAGPGVEGEVAQPSAKPCPSDGQKSKGKVQNKTTFNKTNNTSKAPSSTSEATGCVAACGFPPGYDATLSGFKDAISETTREPLDMETLRLHDRLLKLNMEIAAGAWSMSEHNKGSRKHVIKLTGMETDWSPTALNICGNSAALAVAFVSAASGEIKKYLVKKGLSPEQFRIDSEGYRFGLRCQDHFLNQLDISLGKKAKYPFGYGFNIVEDFHGVAIPAPCAPLISGSSGSPGIPGGNSAGATVHRGAPSLSKPVVGSSSSSKVPCAPSSTPNPGPGPLHHMPKASSSATGPSAAYIAQLANIIQGAAKPSVDRNLALQIATMIEDGVSTVATEAAKIPGLTSEMVIALAQSTQVPLPPHFNTNTSHSSSTIQTTQTNTAGASSTASLNTGTEKTPSGSLSSGKKKKRQAVKKGGRRL